MCLKKNPNAPRPSIYSGRQTRGRTSRGHTVGRSHRICPPSSCSACLNFYREKDSAVDRNAEVSASTNQSLSHSHSSILLLLLFIYLFWGGGNPRSYDCTEIQTHVPTSEGFEVTTGATGASAEVVNSILVRTRICVISSVAESVRT